MMSCRKELYNFNTSKHLESDLYKQYLLLYNAICSMLFFYIQRLHVLLVLLYTYIIRKCAAEKHWATGSERMASSFCSSMFSYEGESEKHINFGKLDQYLLMCHRICTASIALQCIIQHICTKFNERTVNKIY